MKKKILVLLVTLTTLFSGAGSMLFVAPAAVMAQAPKDAACDGLALAGGSCDPVAGQPTVESTLAVVINIFSWVVGIAGVIMIIIGGFKYITSGGNEQGVNSAKNTILFAIIGLVIVAIAQIIVQFVISEATAPPPQPTP
jgi:hypothetical protein